MIVEGEFTFQGPREMVWNLLQDPEVLAKALPGAKTLTQTAEDRFEGAMQVGVGPVTAGAFSVTVVLKDQVAPERFSMQVDGKGGIGFTRGTASVELRAAEGGGTLMKYRADLQIGGKIAGVGQRVLDSASRAMTKQGLEAVNRELQSRLTGAAPAPARSRTRYWAAAALALVALTIALCGGPWQ
ncbi:MAG: carbon monoxide dehydrogenase subunit G [Gemmatimonadetes bacterium]|nr:carbon monoxide dehydrogenase subunit G [Gemmatimonadota bacterium]